MWHNKGPVHWTRVSGILCWPFLEQALASWGSLSLGKGLLGVFRFFPAWAFGPLWRDEGVASSFPGEGTKGLCESQGDDGGRFSAQGTGRRAVKCFDPTQDHQRRKHWAGLDMPVKSECTVIEEDQIPL